MNSHKNHGRILYYMEAAVNASLSRQGFTADNPSVGCVVVNNNEIVGKGVTGLNGCPHAETIALKVAAQKAKGADLYTTLEPCAHQGRTAPCVDLIIQSGIKRVFIGIKDPDKRVNGKGIEKLQASGISVVTGVLKKACFLGNIGYLYRKVLGRPFVILKTATTLDGKIACSNGKSRWITSPEMRRIGHKLRAITSSTMVSYSNILQDNPNLNCRLLGVRKESIKVVLDAKGELSSPTLRIFENGITWSFGKKNSFQHRRFFNFEAKVEENRLDLNDVLNQLGEMGINSVLVEAGSKLFASYIKGDFFDQLVWFRVNKIAGADALSCCGNLEFSDPSQFINMKKMHEIRMHTETVDFFLNTDNKRFNSILKVI